MTYLIIIFRSLIFYIIISFINKYIKIKETKDLNIKNIIILFVITILALTSIKEYNKPLITFILPIASIILLDMFYQYITNKIKKPIIINKGKINFKELIKHYNLKTLLLELHKNNIRTIEEVDYAILNPYGTLSIIAQNKRD